MPDPQDLDEQPPGIGLRLLSVAFWTFLFVSSLLLFPLCLLVWLLTLPFDRKGVLLHRLTCFWASLYTWLNPVWRVTLRGLHHFRRGVTYVITSNHQSLLDILVLFRLFRHFKWVAKIEIFRIPVVGWNMSLNRYIPLRRGDAASIAAMFEKCRQTLARGSSILLFPEGSRSKDGKLRPFKHGAFTLAKELGVAVLPIVLRGTGKALPKAGLVLQGKHAISVEVLPEIPPEDFPDGPASALAEQVRLRFSQALGEAG